MRKGVLLLLALLFVSACGTTTFIVVRRGKLDLERPGAVLPEAASRVYYVSLKGNDEWSGTLAEPNVSGTDGPWKNIKKAANTLQAGDTVFIREGTYKEQVIPKNSGSANNYITYTVYQKENVVVDGTSVALDNSDWGGLIKINQKAYIKIIGLQIRNSFGGSPGPAGIHVQNSNHIFLLNNSTYNTRSSGIYVKDSSYITADGNNVEQAVNGGSQECISFSGVTNFEVKNNKVHNGVGFYSGGEGIDIKDSSSYGAVHHNHVYDLPGEVGIYIDSYSGHLHDVEVYNNETSTSQAMAINAEQGGITENIRVYNNVIYNADLDGLQVSDCCSGNEGMKRNIELSNNTIYHCGYGGYGGGIAIRATKLENLSIKNNIVSQNNLWQIRDKTGLAKASKNLIDGYRKYGGEIAPDGVNNLSGSPLFVNPGTYNFALQSGSPAIKAGVQVYVNPTVYTGNTAAVLLAFDFKDYTRFQGNYDIGAYGYGGTPGTFPTPTVTPTVSPTVTPTPTPTGAPTPTSTPVPTLTPTPSPTPSSTSPSTQIIIDNGTSGYVESANDWFDSSYAGSYGTKSRANHCLPSGDSASWSTTIPTTGTWSIHAWWTAGVGRVTDVKYKIYRGTTLLETKSVNQQVNGGAFNLLGNYAFNSGDTAKVTILDNSSVCGCPVEPCTVSADSVKFSMGTPSTPIVTPTPTPTSTSTPIQPSDTIGPAITVKKCWLGICSGLSSGYTFPSWSSVKFVASAKDASQISSIQVFFDGDLKATCTGVASCSLKLSVRSVSVGNHVLQVVAVDNSANKNPASSVYVLVK